MISPYALQYDPEYYPEPNKFDPDRFSDENKAGRHPFVYLPFGEGPRICIGNSIKTKMDQFTLIYSNLGLRFGLMQSRVGLALILKDFKVKLNPKTVLPLGQNPRSFMLLAKNDLFLDMEKL